MLLRSLGTGTTEPVIAREGIVFSLGVSPMGNPSLRLARGWLSSFRPASKLTWIRERSACGGTWGATILA